MSREAADGQQALDAAKKQQFDLVLSDVNMPVMDGITLVQNLRTLPPKIHSDPHADHRVRRG